MKKHLPLVLVLFSLLSYNTILSQSRVSHEIGFSFGIASFQTDFGVRNDFPSANASTFTFGIAHYLKFFGSQYSWRSGSSYFSQHFKLKTEFNYMLNSNIQHEGSLKNNAQLQRMTGEIKMYNIGMSLEYYLFEIEDFSSFYKNAGTLNPFISAGLHYSFFDPDIKVDGVSLEGQSEPYLDLIPKWQNNAIYLDKSSTLGASIGAGLRYSIDTFDLFVDGRWQYFFSDKVDGLDDTSSVSASKNNDTMVLVNFGVVYVFGKGY